MSSQLTTEQTVQESELVRDQDTEVTVTFKISREAMDQLVSRGTTRRQFEEALTTLLACGLYTRIQAMRDAQSQIEATTHDKAGNPIVPTIRRNADLRQAGRYAQLGLTSIEAALVWADKAAPLVR